MRHAADTQATHMVNGEAPASSMGDPQQQGQHWFSSLIAGPRPDSRPAGGNKTDSREGSPSTTPTHQVSFFFTIFVNLITPPL